MQARYRVGSLQYWAPQGTQKMTVDVAGSSKMQGEVSRWGVGKEWKLKINRRRKSGD